MTGFRLYLDTNYDVSAWPFPCKWDEILAQLPAELPGAVTDFDLFLPDDCDNGAHGAIERQHASVATRMAVYRDGDALIVLLSMIDPIPLAKRFAPAGDDAALLYATADPETDQMLYVGVNRRGEWITLLLDQIHADASGDEPKVTQLPTGGQAVARNFAGGWAAALRFAIDAVPGAGPDPGSLRFSACRIVGATRETIGWTVAPIWFPMLNDLGTLRLMPHRQAGAGLHRADLLYDEASETGELVLTLHGVEAGDTVPVKITVNTFVSTLDAQETSRHRIAPEDGHNAITVKVGNQRSVAFGLEKWSGHRLFPRYTSSLPLADLNALRADFHAVHSRQELHYCGNGMWSDSIASEAEDPPMPDGSESIAHYCAFWAIPYAWACLRLERHREYEARVYEACERMLRSERSGGLFRPHPIPQGGNPWDDGAFAQGSVGEALLLGYRVFGDERYLAASQRGAAAYDSYSLEANTNYMAFLLWHVAELYELTGDTYNLERGVWYAEHAIIRGLNPSGAHPGHNYYSAYGDITLKGMAKLLRVLPGEHEFYPVLRERIIRYTNQILSRQLANGLFEGRNRKYRGYQHPINGLFEVVRALPEFAPDLEPVFIRMLHAKTNTLGLAQSHIGINEIAMMARYIAEKNAAAPPSTA